MHVGNNKAELEGVQMQRTLAEERDLDQRLALPGNASVHWAHAHQFVG
jgi:hypothetical protein